MSDCPHPDFAAFVDVNRLFDVELDEATAIVTPPDSVAVDVRVECAACGKRVRFEGPVGVAVGPGAPPMVSFDGIELRASGHLGENRTRPVRATMRTHEPQEAPGDPGST